jgi:two-component system sensor histidine kinase/response regulator
MSKSGKLILIVDDNLKNLELAATFLNTEGYQLSLAQESNSAISLMEQNLPDLVLLDIMMPEMDGLELCRYIKSKENLKEIPVIFLTGKAETEDLAAGFAAGGVDYITKPFKSEELRIRIKTHLELSLSRRKIIEMTHTRDKLYSIISHDIRSPFASISFAISSLANGVLKSDSAEFKQILQYLEKSTNETKLLLDNLLTWTRIQTEAISLFPKQQEIHPLVDSCVQILEGYAKRKNIQILVDIDKDISGYFDELSIATVIRNLLTNSIKFTPENGVINLKTETSKDYVKIYVKDNGIGIPQEIIEKVFGNNEYYTTQGTNDEQGSGLGSQIIIDFVKRNKGKIEVKSTSGNGTEIVVYLPLTVA